MDINTVVSLISNVGFPIACVFGLFYLFNRQSEDRRQDTSKWIEAINNNTKVIEKLVEKMDK